jgi:hypothetical protein
MLHVRLSDPGLSPSLRGFLARVSAAAELTTDPRVLAVELPGAPSPAHELREIVNYLDTWQGLTGGCTIETVELRPTPARSELALAA